MYVGDSVQNIEYRCKTTIDLLIRIFCSYSCETYIIKRKITLPVICHLSTIICQLSSTSVIHQLTSVNYNLSPVISHLSTLICNLLFT